MHIDHVVPKKLGGKNNIKNLNPSCQSCNSTKGAKSLEDYRIHLMIKNLSSPVLSTSHNGETFVD